MKEKNLKQLKKLHIVVDINHPAHVHFFRNFIKIAQKKGHKVLITASRKEMTQVLLKKYRLPFVNMGSYGDKAWQKVFMIPVMDYRMWRAAKNFKPDLFLGIASIRGPHAAKFLGAKAINFDDTGYPMTVKLYYPFVEAVFTPQCFKPIFGKKQIRYNGFHELAYVHPRYYKPKNINRELGLKKTDPYFIVRFVGWGAGHDIGQGGFTTAEKVKLVKLLEGFGKVFITSEKGVPVELKKNILKNSPEKIFDLMAHARMVISEGATVASEAALIGVPTVSVNSIYCDTLAEQQKLGILRYFLDGKRALAYIKKAVKDKELIQKNRVAQKKALKKLEDITELLLSILAKSLESKK
jgi:predicted glycosyltransferase